jgi:lysozyme family protein
MADFTTAYNLTMGVEGGYANNPNDHGGQTWKGIAQKMHPEWTGWAIIELAKSQPDFPSCLKKNNDLERMVRAFYKEQFWNCLGLDQVNDQKIANELFDTSVNCGQGTAAMILQRALNVCSNSFRDYAKLMVDGQVGSKTIGVLNTHKRPALVLKILNVLQGERYINICENNPSQDEFINSWMSRVAI